MSVIPISNVVEENDELKSVKLLLPCGTEVIFCYVDNYELQTELESGAVILKSILPLSTFLDEVFMNYK